MSDDLAWLTATQASRAFAARKLSPTELVRALLARIERLDPKLNAFIRLDAEAALAAAATAEAEIAAGRHRGPLHGVPVGIKDIIDVVGLPTTCHSKVMPTTPATADAVVVGKLRQAGAVIMGKLSTHEFAIGGPSFDLPGPPPATPGTVTTTPAAPPPAPASASAPGSSRWRWARIPAAPCATRPAPAASSASSPPTAWSPAAACSRSPSRSTMSGR